MFKKSGRTAHRHHGARTHTLVGTGLAAIAAASAIAAPAHAAPTPNVCTYNEQTKVVTVTMAPGGGPFVQFGLDNGFIEYHDTFGEHNCFSPNQLTARLTNTASVLIKGTAAKDDFIISQLGGKFDGGAPGGADPSQMEIVVSSGTNDIVDIVGTDGFDAIAVTGGPGTGKPGGALLNAFNNQNLSVRMTNAPSAVRANGLGGGDFLVGSGFLASPTSMHVELTGGTGGDVIDGGLLAGDLLSGEEGNDSLRSDDGQPGDFVSGGAGLDTATIDKTDQASLIDRFNQPVGTLKLNPTRIAAAKGSANLAMSWTHPTSWKQLKSITLAAYDGDKLAGSITMNPATEKLTARGALKLQAGAKVSHNGKTVTAKLPVEVSNAVIGDGLRLAVKATDKSGNQQVDAGAGFLTASSGT